MKGFGSQLIARNLTGIFSHHGVDRPLEEVRSRFQAAADVAVRNEADEAAFFVDDRHGAQSLFRHHEQGVLHDAVFGNDRIVIALVHDVFNGHEQLAAESSAGMINGKLIFRKVMTRQQDDSQGVAEG